jgi:EAL domain-containing protein (putative c-di-GMP-specific phosphodiesterase class I)
MKDTDIVQAIKDNNIIPFYQAIVCNETESIIKYECLARLLINQEYLSPYSFLDIAKANNIIDLVTKQMIVKCFDYFKNKKDVRFSINLSFMDLTTASTRRLLKRKVATFPYPKNITFEFLEDNSIEFLFTNNKTSSSALKCIEFLRTKGCKLALDDFGSGYSNFINIEYLNVDYIKFDGSIIKNITRAVPFHLVMSVSELAKKLNIQTIAEFVENKETFDIVKQLGINYSQGYYFGKPQVAIVENNDLKIYLDKEGEKCNVYS